jgi:hypothetical protein
MKWQEQLALVKAFKKKKDLRLLIHECVDHLMQDKA